MAAKTPLDYQTLFNVLPNPYIAVLPDDPVFTIVAENDAHASIANITDSSSSIGKPLFEVFPDVSEQYQTTGVSELKESFRRVIRTGTPDSMPVLRYDIPDANGGFSERFWRLTHYPVFDATGTLQAIYQATKDITDETVSSIKLKQTQQQLDEALSSGLIGTWLWDVQKDIVVGDRYMATMYGVSEADAAAGLPLTRFVESIHPDDRARIQKEITKALKSSEIFAMEYRTLRPDNSIRWILARGRIERDATGTPVQFPGVLVDVTDRKIIEDNLSFLSKASVVLAESLNYKKTMQNIADLAVPRIADWCTVDILSDGGLQQVALAHKDPQKVDWAIELRKQQGEPDLSGQTGLAKVLKTGKPEFFPEITEELIIASAKTKKELKLLQGLGMSSIIMVPLLIDKKPAGAITLISAEQKRHYTTADLEMAQALAGRASIAITNAKLYDSAQQELKKRKKLEDQLRLANEGLERRVEERTAQLEVTNTNLERSNRELQDFAYVASHDLQEPLRKIQAFGNLLEEEYADKLDDGRDYLERMRGAAKRMSALIEDILSFSRVTTKGRGFSPVDLTVIAREVLEDLETRINDTKATVIIDKLPTIDADAMQIRQLLQNLISNALKFHKPDVAPVVKLSARTDISQGRRKKTCIITIEDNGVGFDEKYLDRIFAVFQRLHTRDSYEGTGIGLAVCRKIVERHGGTITASSQPGKGATFVVSLPIYHKPVVHQEP